MRRRVGGAYGHLSNDQAARFLGCLEQGRLRHLVVAHLSELDKKKGERVSNLVLSRLVCDMQGGQVFLDGSKDSARLLHYLRSGEWDIKVIYLQRDGRGVTNSYVKHDRVDYDEAPPWPPEPAGWGPTLELVSPLADNLLAPLLGIEDPRRDRRIAFVGGIRGPEELAARVDRGDAAVAFSMYPTSMEELMRVADAGRVMPPKSTWFEPKLRSGLIVRPLGDS